MSGGANGTPTHGTATEALKRPFAVGAALVLLLVAGVTVLINRLDARQHRPEGAAERWLDAVSDTTRTGVKADGRARAERLGPGVAYAALLTADAGGKSGFEDLQIGKAARAGTVARVPFAAHERNGPALKEAITLQRQPNGTWHVTGFGSRRPGERVPSEGGSVPSKAGLGLWLLFGAIALAFGVGASWLVNWAGPPPAPQPS